nr:hypothetical protein [Tanacetum cinerariifolium]
MSTVDAEISSKISEAVTKKGGSFLKAPVSGSKKLALDNAPFALVVKDYHSTICQVKCCIDFWDYMRQFFQHSMYWERSRFSWGSGRLGYKHKSMMNAFSEGLVLADESGLSSKTLLDVLDLGAIANPMFKMKGPSMIQNSYNHAFPLKRQ